MDPGDILSALPPPPEGFSPLSPMTDAPGPPPGMMPIPLMPRRDALGPSMGPTKDLSTSIVGGGEPVMSPFTPRPELINAIAHHESGNNPAAIGKKGERGAMQVMPATAAMYGISDPTQLNDPQIGMQIGTRYYADLLKRYKGNEWKALVAYNEGPGRVDKGQFLPESVKYANAILDRARGGMPAGPQPPVMMAQGGMPPPMMQQPSVLSQMGGAVSGLLGEGTAEAQELPPPPPGFAPMPTGSTAEIPTVAPSASPPPSAPPPTEAPALPRGQGSATGMIVPPIPAGGGFAPGMKMSVGMGPFRVTTGSEATTAEVSKEEALRRQAQQLINLGNEMNDLYNKRIKPKLDSGEIHSLGEGLIYTERSNARSLGENLDPDVEDWIIKSGQFSTGLNSYYAAQSGGRGGISYLEQGTEPHVPHPPAGLREVFGVWSPTGQQWDLGQQGEALPKILHNLRRDMGTEGEQRYVPYSSARGGLVRLPSGKLYNPSTGEVSP